MRVVTVVVVDRAMGGIEVHARRLVAQGKTSSAETESPASVCLSTDVWTAAASSFVGPPVHRFSTFLLTNNSLADQVCDDNNIRILAAAARIIAFSTAVRPTILTTQRPHCIARLSSTAIGDYLCSTRFPLRSGCYGCVDRGGR